MINVEGQESLETLEEVEGMEVRVTVLLFESKEGPWVAQGLEFDIAAQGSNSEDAIVSFGRVFLGQMIVNVHHGKTPLADIPQAPGQYWEQARTAKRFPDRRIEYLPAHLPAEIPPAFMIPAFPQLTQLLST